MIIPILRGLLGPSRVPFTYFLLFVNVFVFVLTYSSFQKADTRMDALLEDSAFIETQGLAFATMISKEPKQFTATLREMSRQVLEGKSRSKRILGNLALRNPLFMEKAADFEFAGDEVAIGEWRGKYRELREVMSQHPSYQWGISQMHNSLVQWLRYQFAHSGFTHLFWNMLFLLLFGTFIEVHLGGAVVLLTYLGGGFAGAFAFSGLSGISASPLVGASGAISGLMGLVAAGWFRREKLKFFFWLLPARGYYGLVLLPSWVVIMAFILPDLSGYISAVPEYGSIAYAAHLGGTAFGVAIAFLVHYGWLAFNPAAEEGGGLLAFAYDPAKSDETKMAG